MRSLGSGILGLILGVRTSSWGIMFVLGLLRMLDSIDILPSLVIKKIE